MNIIKFKVTDSFYTRIEIEVDGKPLVEIMRAIELPMAVKEGSQHLAGDYEAIMMPANPFAHFLGDEEYAYWGEGAIKLHC